MVPSTRQIVLQVLLFVIIDFALSKDISFQNLRRAQIRLAHITRPSVCHTRRLNSINQASLAFNSTCSTGQEKSVTCKTLHNKLQVARGAKCPDLPENEDVKAAVQRLQEEANTLSSESRLKPPFKTLVLEPAGAVPHVTAVFLHGAGQTEENVRLGLEVFQTGIRSGALPPARILLPLAFNRSLQPILPYSAPLWSTSDNLQMEEAAQNVSKLQDIEAKMFGTDRWLAGVFGYSQGAFLSLAVSLRTRVSAVAALAGGFRNISIPDSSTRKISDDSHTLFIIGDGDGNLEDVKLSYRKLIGFGRKAKLVILKGVGHGFEGKVNEVAEKSFSTLRKGMFPGRVDRRISPPSLLWTWGM